MSGHSKWHSIKHKKAKTDAARGRMFTRLIKEISVAARNGGGDVEGNPRLRTAVAAAKAANMPAANIDRAIKKGTGELPGVQYEEVTYEGYAPGGVALLIELLTDNKNRAVSDVRHILNRHGGSMAEAGSVAWMFEKKGVIRVEDPAVAEDRLMEVVLENGAEDLSGGPGSFEVASSPGRLEAVKAALEAAHIPVASAELTMVPKTQTPVGADHAGAVMRLVNALEDLDDVQNLYANFDIDEKLLEELQAE